MSKKYQNFFFLFGITVLIMMVANLPFAEVWRDICHAGYWLLAVVALWAVLYVFSTLAWYIIIRSGHKEPLPFSFLWLYKVTVSGFSLNYATPGGLMGGEPYRIMELSPKIGTTRSTSSVILHAMTHIFSHFWFWLLSVVLYVLTQPLNTFMLMLLAAVTIFCIAGLWFFMAGYRKGLANRLLYILCRIPFLRRRAHRFVEQHKEQLDTIDTQIAALHRQNPVTFVSAVLLELGERVVSALEIYFILLVMPPSGDFVQCILILAFTSLFANLLFFMPLQLGGREGGFLMSVNGLGLAVSSGNFVALIVRLRELLWTALGLLLIKFHRK